MIKEELSV